MKDTLDQYVERLTESESSLLKKINRETHLQSDQAHMLSGHVQGRLLSLLSRLIQPTTILEIGTFTGYSALCLAEGLSEDGHLHTIDINDELEEKCKAYFREAQMEDQISLHIGDAKHIIPQIDGFFDLVFIDADKPSYSDYFDLVIDRVSSKGLIIVDNVLYHQEVLLPDHKRSKNGRAIAAFNEKIRVDPRVEKVLLNIRDGLLLLNKK